jgi:hypothetical protein
MSSRWGWPAAPPGPALRQRLGRARSLPWRGCCVGPRRRKKAVQPQAHACATTDRSDQGLQPRIGIRDGVAGAIPPVLVLTAHKRSGYVAHDCHWTVLKTGKSAEADQLTELRPNSRGLYIKSRVRMQRLRAPTIPTRPARQSGRHRRQGLGAPPPGSLRCPSGPEVEAPCRRRPSERRRPR